MWLHMSCLNVHLYKYLILLTRSGMGKSIQMSGFKLALEWDVCMHCNSSELLQFIVLNKVNISM